MFMAAGFVWLWPSVARVIEWRHKGHNPFWAFFILKWNRTSRFERLLASGLSSMSNWRLSVLCRTSRRLHNLYAARSCVYSCPSICMLLRTLSLSIPRERDISRLCEHGVSSTEASACAKFCVTRRVPVRNRPPYYAYGLRECSPRLYLGFVVVSTDTMLQCTPIHLHDIAISLSFEPA